MLSNIQGDHVWEKQLKEISRYKEFNSVFSLLVKYKYAKQFDELERKKGKTKIILELNNIISKYTIRMFTRSSNQRRSMLASWGNPTNRSVIENPRFLKFY